jgi:NADP-dependent 3-hydroxy acid dehydrogenase YdfG
MAKRFWAGVIVFGALLGVGSLQAHHSLAGTYDLNKTERATGMIQKLAFTNPHGALTIEIKDREGVAKTWILTTGSINVLVNAGVSATGPNRLKQGDVIQVSFNPAKNGSNLGFLRSMTLPDKKEVEFVPN